jgi:hypothetical protein
MKQLLAALAAMTMIGNQSAAPVATVVRAARLIDGRGEV